MVDQEKTSWRSLWAFALFLVLVTLISYAPAVTGGYVWDDDVDVVQNPLLTASDGLRRIWLTLESPAEYFPLTLSSFYIERNFLWGGNPAGYHLVNILLHASGAILLWQVLMRLSVPGARLAAGIFALHPVQVESVAWITERKNVLMGFFFLLSVLAWVRFIDEKCKHPRLCFALSLVCAALALFAKTTACTLPAALLLILWLRRLPVDGRRIAQIAPFVAMGLAQGLVSMKWEHLHQGLQPNMFNISLGQRALIASRAIWFYAGKLFWPVNLSVCYPRWNVSTSDPLAYVWVAATAALALGIFRARRRLGRGPEVGLVFFVATLSPMLCVIMHYFYMYSFVADHFQYLACIGIMALAAAGVELGLKGIAVWGQVLYPLCGAVLLTILGALTWKQCHIYASDEILWQATLQQNPDSLLAHASLGAIASEEGQPDLALFHFQKALAINSNFAQVHYDLALTFAQLGRIDDAISEYRKEIQIAPSNALAYNNLGQALAQKGKLDEAIGYLRRALQINPNLAQATLNLGTSLMLKGERKEAIEYFQQAVKLRPEDPVPRSKLAWMLATSPEDSLRKGPRAIELARKAIELSGHDDPVLLQVLAAACAESGQFREAIQTARRALELAGAQSNANLTAQLQSELQLYQFGKPFHQPVKNP